MPSDTTVNNDANLCSAVVNYDFPTASDNCPEPSTGSAFLYSGNAAIPDFSGSPGVLSQTLNVSGINNQLGANATLTDVCININHTWVGDLTIQLTSPQGTVYELSSNNGGSGDNYSNTCFNMSALTPITSGFPSFTGVFLPEGAGGFSVFDTEDPNGNWTITVIDGSAGDVGSLLNFSLSFTSNGYNIIQIAGLPSGSAFPVGTTYNIFSVTDDQGNVGYDTSLVVVNDVEAPLINCFADTTFSADQNACFATLAFPGFPPTSDNCAVDSIFNDAPANFPVGTTTVTWTVVDVHGNTASCTQDITITDDEAPSISCPQDQSLAFNSSCNATLPDYTGLAVTNDNCPSVTVTQSPAAGTVVSGGTATVTLTVTDVGGLTASCSFDVIDSSIPTLITAAADLTVSCDGNGNISDINSWLANNAGAQATDNCGATITWTNNYTGLSDLCGQTGAATVIFSGSDNFGNVVTSTATFTIVDTTAPVMIAPVTDSLPNDPSLCGAFAEQVLPTVSDNCDLTAITPLTSTNFSTLFPVGTTTVQYTATDSCGNSDTISYDVVVSDYEAPLVINANDLLLNVSGPADMTEIAWSLKDNNGLTVP